jgi:hypothetical protein
MIGGFFVAGVLIGFALSDKVHEQVFDGMSKENSRLWAENRVLRGGKQ